MTNTSTDVVRKRYADGPYSAADVSRAPGGDSYFDRLLQVKLDLVARYAKDALALDVGCGNGAHLAALAPQLRAGVGVDITLPFLREASRGGARAATFVQADCRRLPLVDGCMDLVWALSVLYHFADLSGPLQEIARVLKPGGHCVLDLGARPSLNAIVAAAHTEGAPCFPQSVGTMLRAIRACGLQVVTRRSFQLLPMWGSRPRWARPFLWRGWVRLFSVRLFGRMLDEWVSSLPLLNRLAFRHVVVCRKPMC